MVSACPACGLHTTRAGGVGPATLGNWSSDLGPRDANAVLKWHVIEKTPCVRPAAGIMYPVVGRTERSNGKWRHEMICCTCSEAELVGAIDAPVRAQPTRKTIVPIAAHPLIGETPRPALQSWLTPNPLFYVRNHFATPSIALSSWKLSVSGHVSRPHELEFGAIQTLPKYTLTVTLECAGNNRSDLVPPATGNQFHDGAVSTAVWAGAALKDVLASAEMLPGAREVLFAGADKGVVGAGMPSMRYLRSLPLDVATHPDALLAYEMNGEALAKEHGYPLRLVVPGWYGMASVKWLSRVEVLDHAFEGYFQTKAYVIEDDDGQPIQLSRMSVKSVINSPVQGQTVRNERVCVSGLAWSGSARIRQVELSTDGGGSWQPAEITGPSERYAWRQWHVTWDPPGPGHYTLAARAEDEEGNVQPEEARWNRLGYVANGLKPVCVSVV